MFPKLKELRVVEEHVRYLSRSMFSQHIKLLYSGVEKVTIERNPEKEEILKETEQTLRLALNSQFPNAVTSLVYNSD